ncbi:hypothetical protein Tco_1240669 [Tanacetum coccineum]
MDSWRWPLSGVRRSWPVSGAGGGLPWGRSPTLKIKWKGKGLASATCHWPAAPLKIRVTLLGICLLAWMGWNADIEGRGLGELCTFDKIF